MPKINHDEVTTIAIDSQGQFECTLTFQDSHSQTVNILLSGTDTADYEVYVGGEDEDGGVNWFDGITPKFSYSGVSEIDETFDTPARYVRVDVTAAASTGGATAELLIASGT